MFILVVTFSYFIWVWAKFGLKFDFAFIWLLVLYTVMVLKMQNCNNLKLFTKSVIYSVITVTKISQILVNNVKVYDSDKYLSANKYSLLH